MLFIWLFYDFLQFIIYFYFEYDFYHTALRITKALKLFFYLTVKVADSQEFGNNLSIY